MREIKFRAMNELNNWVFFDIWAINPPLDKAIFKNICQFTGLKDKNGKEIYEGDILKHGEYCNGSVTGEYISQVQWGESGDSDGYCYGGHLEYITIENHNSLSDIHGACEIIGNIYSNPELLNTEADCQKRKLND